MGGARAGLRSLLIERAPSLFLRLCTPGERELGRVGEELAARALRRAGWRLLGRRLATPAAEIDLVARDGDELVCVEVKTGRLPVLPRTRTSVPSRRTELRWRPGGRLDRRRLERQRRAARWLARTLGGGCGRRARVDLIEVLVRPRGRVELVHHRDLAAPLPNPH